MTKSMLLVMVLAGCGGGAKEVPMTPEYSKADERPCDDFVTEAAKVAAQAPYKLAQQDVEDRKSSRSLMPTPTSKPTRLAEFFIGHKLLCRGTATWANDQQKDSLGSSAQFACKLHVFADQAAREAFDKWREGKASEKSRGDARDGRALFHCHDVDTVTPEIIELGRGFVEKYR